MRTFVHILDQCSQDWFAVLSVIENLLDEIVQTTPETKQIFLRRDNVGCYHNGQLFILFFLFINFADNTLHYIKRQEQDLHNEIQYITTAGFPQQRIANYCGPDTKYSSSIIITNISILSYICIAVYTYVSTITDYIYEYTHTHNYITDKMLFKI